jgi:hypothetical protein
MAVTVRVVSIPQGIKDLEHSSAVGHLALRPVAGEILEDARTRAPNWDAVATWRWWIRGGKGPQGAFAQAIVTGSGTLLAEFGGSRSPAYAYLRSSL